MKRQWIWIPLALSLAGLLTIEAEQLGAQETASLSAVESYLGQGRIQQAREILQLWLDSQGATASRSDRQRGLWLRAKLTVDPNMAELDLRRLALEYPGGPYSDDALYRMALFAEGRGDLRDAQRHFQDLARDYPVSPFLEEAQEWLREHRDAVAALPPEAPREAAPRPEPPPVPILDVEEGNVAVQAGAFQSMDRARQLAARLRDAGFSPRLVRVPGSELSRVRMGRFPSRDEAEALATRIRNLGFEVTIVTDADAEEEIG